MRARERVLAAVLAQAREVIASKVPDNSSTGILLRAGAVTACLARATRHARQSENRCAICGDNARTRFEKPGRALRAAASAWPGVANGASSLQKTPNASPSPASPTLAAEAVASKRVADCGACRLAISCTIAGICTMLPGVRLNATS